MYVFLTTLAFILIGALCGLLIFKRFKGSNILVNVIAGIGGSLFLSGILYLRNLGGGFTTFTLIGVAAAIGGGLLAPLLYSLIHEQYAKTRTKEMPRT